MISTKATIIEEGDQVCYFPSQDLIYMPDRRRSAGTEVISAANGFCATLCHELVHWSVAKFRLARNLTGRFGNEAYAIEGLVAELGSAFLRADLSLSELARVDHASYIKNWFTVLKNDKKAIFAAASKASQAADYLQAFETVT